MAKAKANLQWSRDLSAAEGRVDLHVRTPESPSMEPRPLGRGRGRARRPRGREGASFNGAATSRPRKGPEPDDLIGPGKILQWSRDLSAAEGRQRGAPDRAALRPSMEPRPLGRGRLDQAAPHHDTHGLPSMEPRPLGRGRGKRGIGASASDNLQWSRDLSAAEGSSASTQTSLSCSFNGAATSRPRKA